MTRTLLVAALATLATGAALAQGNITIYGRLNVTGEYQENDAGQKTSNLVNNASRLGFLGTEDLGGGLKAGFQLEHGFNIDNGLPTSTAFWGRQSEVNIGSSRMGTLRLGRFTSEAYYATADYVSLHNHDTGTSADALYAYVSDNNNKLAYRLPEFVKGMSLEGAMTLGEGQTSRSYDLALNYAMGGGLAFGAGYALKEDGFGLNSANQFALRAYYEMGNGFTFGGYVQWDKNGMDASRDLGNRTSFRLSGMYAMGVTEFHVNYGYADDYDKVAGSKAEQFTLGINYNLSKRTKVYTFVTNISDGSAKVYGGDFTSFAVGMRHNF